MQLTTERLNLEYTQWMLEHSEGRDKADMRFAQYIDLKYDYEVHNYLDDTFYIESATKAYGILLESLILQNIKNTL